MTHKGTHLELGAQWIHGKHNPVYKLAKKHNLIAEETSREAKGIFVRDDGSIIDETLVDKVDFEVGRILYECEGFVDACDYPSSVREHLSSQFMKYLENSEENEEQKQLMSELCDWHVRFQVIDNSCVDLKKVSAREWGRYEICNGQEHINTKHGYKAIIDVLLEILPKYALKLNTEVVNIKCNDYITLECKNEKIIAKHVILTPSLGVLKSFLQNISPPLPKNMCRAIKNMGFHGIGKIYLIFDYKWWDCGGIQLVWRKDSFLDENEQWTQYITGFDEVWNIPNALLGWIGGAGVETMEQLSENEVGHCCTDLLRKFLAGRYRDIPAPKKVIR